MPRPVTYQFLEMNYPLCVITGEKGGTFSMGWRVKGVVTRDPRFAPSMSYQEADWSVRNQRELAPGFYNLMKGK